MPFQRFRQRQGFAVNRDRLITFQPQQLNQLFHQSRIVLIPDAQRIARLITQPGVSEVDFNMTHIFFRIAAGNFLIHRQCRRQRRFFGIRAGVNVIHRPARRSLGRSRDGRTRFQDFNNPRAPFCRRRLVLDVCVNAIQQTFSTQLSQTAVKIFSGLAEEFVRGIT